MKAKIILFISILFLSTHIFSQQMGQIDLLTPSKTANGIASKWSIYNMTAGYGNSLQFWAYDNLGCVSGGMCTNRFTIMDNGNVGIGTMTPNSRLDLGSGYGVNGAKLLLYNDNTASELSGTKCGFYMDNFTSNNLNLVFPEAATVPGLFTISAKNTAGTTLNPYFSIAGLTGNVGIGTTSPSLKMVIAQDVTSNSDVDIAQFGIMGSTDNRKRLVMGYDVNGDGFGFIKSGFYGVKWTNLSLQPTGGNVGIGTTNPDSKLTVKGKIHAEEVKIDLAIPADYVFEKYYLGESSLKPDYTLLTLSEVEQFTEENHHLPNVPSAKEIKENGLLLGEMSNILLQKMEEMTLYMIEQEKKNNIQSKKIEVLEKENQAFKALSERLSKLENQSK